MSKQTKKENVSTENKIGWIISIIISVLLLACGVTKQGAIGLYTNNIMSYIFGKFYFIILLSVIFKGAAKLFNRKLSLKFSIGLVFINVAAILLVPIISGGLQDFNAYKDYLLNGFLQISNLEYDYGAGLIGHGAFLLLLMLIDLKLTTILDILFIIVGILLMIPTEWYKDVIANSKEVRRIKKEERQKEKELKAKQIEEEKAQKEALKAQQRAMLAEKMALEAEMERSKQEEVIEEPIKEEKKIDVTSDSPYFLNINPGKVDETVTKEEETKEKTYKVEYQKVGNYHYPPLSCFEPRQALKSNDVNKKNAKIKGQRLIEVLKQFEIEATLVNTHIGPSVTKFEIKPNSTVKINRIMQISDNLKMELAAKDIRIEAPIPGRSAVGIEIPNAETIPVRMAEMVTGLPKTSDNMTFTLGKDLMGKNVYCDITKMPHLLIAGATGSGKSVCINSIITSILMRSHPDDVKLVLVDPKKVEFSPYHDIPHLLWPVITDAKMASLLLEKLVVIMEQRYEKFSVCGVRNIQTYNEQVIENNSNEANPKMDKMPYIVVIIDELSDLMMVAGKEVEGSIQRITQLARACGIHMIVATQRPSTNVITGVIKANLPSRISFATASSIDSRTILDSVGAENLLGNGDMLYHPQGESSMIRLQGVYVTDQEIANVTGYAKKHCAPKYDDTYYTILNNSSTAKAFGADINRANEVDPLYDEIVDYVVETQKASTSLLQRRFGIGFNRAARIIDTMEDKGIVGPQNGSKPREVYKKKDPKDDE